MDTKSAATLRVGELAKATGLTVRARRHYEQIGLLPPAERTATGPPPLRSGSGREALPVDQVKAARHVAGPDPARPRRPGLEPGQRPATPPGIGGRRTGGARFTAQRRQHRTGQYRRHDRPDTGPIGGSFHHGHPGQPSSPPDLDHGLPRSRRRPPPPGERVRTHPGGRSPADPTAPSSTPRSPPATGSSGCTPKPTPTAWPLPTRAPPRPPPWRSSSRMSMSTTRWSEREAATSSTSPSTNRYRAFGAPRTWPYPWTSFER